jgi:hypothetical protein
MNKLQLNLVESEAKIILESLIEKERKMAEICDTSDDEDEIADIGNDLIELRLLLKEVKEQATSKFGSSILEFSRDSL